jgi:hypothetical protein
MPNLPTLLSREDMTTLENLIDRYGVEAILMGMAEIAYEKAQHIAENWPATNEQEQVRAWQRVSRLLDGTSTHRAVKAVTYK